jgi:hypothetical protein
MMTTTLERAAQAVHQHFPALPTSSAKLEEGLAALPSQTAKLIKRALNADGFARLSRAAGAARKADARTNRQAKAEADLGAHRPGNATLAYFAAQRSVHAPRSVKEHAALAAAEVERGRELAAAGRWHEAEIELRSAIERQGEIDVWREKPNGAAHYELARVLVLSGAGAEARVLDQLELAVSGGQSFAKRAAADAAFAALRGKSRFEELLHDPRTARDRDHLHSLYLRSGLDVAALTKGVPALAGLRKPRNTEDEDALWTVLAGRAASPVGSNSVSFLAVHRAQALAGYSRAELAATLQLLPGLPLSAEYRAAWQAVLGLAIARLDYPKVAEAMNAMIGAGRHVRFAAIGEGGEGSVEHGLDRGFEYESFRALLASFHSALAAGVDTEQRWALQGVWQAIKDHVREYCENPQIRPLGASESRTRFDALRYRVVVGYDSSATEYEDRSGRLQRDMAALDRALEEGKASFEVGGALPASAFAAPAAAGKAPRAPWVDGDSNVAAVRAALEQGFALDVKSPKQGVRWSGPEQPSKGEPSFAKQLSPEGLAAAKKEGRDPLDVVLGVAAAVGREQGKRALFSDVNLEPVRKRNARLYDLITDFSSEHSRAKAKAEARKVIDASIADLRALATPDRLVLQLDDVGLPFKGRGADGGWPIDRRLLGHQDVIAPIRDAIEQVATLQRKRGAITWDGVAATDAQGLPTGSIAARLSADALRGRDTLDELVAILVQVEMQQGARNAARSFELEKAIRGLEELGGMIDAGAPWPAIRARSHEATWACYQLVGKSED